ncbi:NADH-quinone oxidoreductase subunit J [Pelagicoccus sp. SDUM812003]|uniref:NADH-quinone oxidoreductase subunit J family protein n=1 Tax=Pelagicoccus sp. SDUM812003 TaxID=3041267 RepID=UPI00280E5B76|nr:NADH-quinone oxidoreductase subunit J [Pelagicoccus sp. SDUM812003]MDQ8202651.1 NADH-quinone oxidoreductase subunit J [Pelagicoccus sp. SDUM812003]
MTELFFYLFSAITLGCGIAVVFSRNPVNAAMFLILAFTGMASLFVMLEAYFLAVIQVLVYAGAVVVLFLFIIMLLDVKEESRHRVKLLTIVASVVGFAILILGVATVVSTDAVAESAQTLPAVTNNTLKSFGYELFTTYLLPMQVTGFLLLVAMIGVIVLSKKVKTD